MASRLRAVLTAGLSIAGYHLPLDAHPEVGNNALLCRELGFEPDGRPFGVVKGRAIGVAGTAADPVPAAELAGRIRRVTQREPLHFASGPAEVRSIGVITGAASSEIHEAIA